MKELIERYLEKEMDDILQHCRNLIAIESVNGVTEKTVEAVEYVVNLADSMGFKTMMTSKKDVGIVEYGGGETILGVLAHVDVVEPGDLKKWTRSPYEMYIDDGKIYGRGIVDDKGPVIQSLYALKFLKDNGLYPENKKIWVIIGSSEESIWTDMDSFKAEFRAPDYGYSPDGNFPVFNMENGYYDIELIFEEENLDGAKNITAGASRNSVASLASYEENGQVHTYDGVGAHSSRPDLGVNAIVKMAKDLKGKKDWRFVNFLDRFFGLSGEETILDRELAETGTGIGDTTVCPTVMVQEGNRIIINFNLRPRYGTKGAQYRELFDRYSGEWQYTTRVIECLEPLYVEANQDWMFRMADAYEAYGFKNSFELALGCSYAKTLDNFVSWGPLFPGDLDTPHMENEFITVESFITATKIYTLYLANEAKS